MPIGHYSGRPLSYLTSRIILRHPPRTRPISDQRPEIKPAEKLKQWREIAVTNGQARFTAWTAAAEQQFALLGSKLNHLTGYELVEQLKSQVVEQGNASIFNATCFI